MSEPNNQNQVTAQHPAIAANDAGLLAPKTIEEAYRLANYYCKSGLLPARFQKPEMVLTAMQFALELGLKPLTALRQIAVVNGTPNTFGDLPLSMCYASGKLESIKEAYIDKSGKELSLANGNIAAEAWGAVCVVKRKGDPEIAESVFTMDDAKRAGLGNSPTWKAYTKRMLRYRARSQALKDKFPDALNGVAILEYDGNLVEETLSEDTTQANRHGGGKAEELTSKLKIQAIPTQATRVAEETVSAAQHDNTPVAVKPKTDKKEEQASQDDGEQTDFESYQGGVLK